MAETENNKNLKTNFNVLTTMYPLNNSRSKKVIVGLHYDKNTKSFEPVIQLLNNHYTQGLELNSKTWCEIQNHFQDISNYFNNLGNIERTEKISVNDVDILFRMALNPLFLTNTFPHVRILVLKVEKHIHRIERITPLVNKCKNFICEELTKLVENSELVKKNSDEIIKMKLQKNIEQIKISVKDNLILYSLN